MTRRRGESRIRWVKRIAKTVVLRGFPEFRAGDRVAIVDDDARAVLGRTGTVEEVVAPFHDWEFRVVGDDLESANQTRYPAEGTLLTAEQIVAISRENGEST